MNKKRYLMEMICGLGLVLVIFWNMAEGLLLAMDDAVETPAELLQKKLEFYSEIRCLDREEFEEKQCGEIGSEVFFGVVANKHLLDPLMISIRVTDVKVLPLKGEEAQEYLRQSTFDGNLCEYAGVMGDSAGELARCAVAVVALELHNYSDEAIQYGDSSFGHYILDENYSIGDTYETRELFTTSNIHFFYHSAEPRLDYARGVKGPNGIVMYREPDYSKVNTHSFYLDPGLQKMTILFLVSDDEIAHGLYLSNSHGVLGVGEDERYYYCNMGYYIKII